MQKLEDQCLILLYYTTLPVLMILTSVIHTEQILILHCYIHKSGIWITSFCQNQEIFLFLDIGKGFFKSNRFGHFQNPLTLTESGNFALLNQTSEPKMVIDPLYGALRVRHQCKVTAVHGLKSLTRPSKTQQKLIPPKRRKIKLAHNTKH